MKNNLQRILPLFIASTLGSQAATLVAYNFDHAGSAPTPLTATTVGTNMSATAVTKTSEGIFMDSTADRLRVRDVPTTTFSTTNDFVSFRIDANSGFYFDLTSASSPTVTFQIGRQGGSSPLVGRIEIWGATSGTASTGSTLLYTSGEVSATNTTMRTVANTTGIAAINSTNKYTSLYAQVQWRTSDAATPVSTDYLFDNFTLAGNVAAIPEPSTWSALMGAVGMLALVRRRR